MTENTKYNIKPGIFWMTGLSGSGKSSLASGVKAKLIQRGFRVCVLDGDNLRSGLNSDLDFSFEGRTENIRRMAEVASIVRDTNCIVIAAAISPFESNRKQAEQICKRDQFYVIHVSCSLKECERRDVKGLYKKARSGEIAQFTGISSPYEEPLESDLVLNTDLEDEETSVQTLLTFVLDKIEAADA